MKQIKKSIFILENIFMITLFASLFSNEIGMIPTSVTSLLNIAFLALGSLVLMYYVITKSDYSLFKLDNWRELVLLMGILLISVIFNIRTGLTPIKKIAFILIQFLVFYPLVKHRVVSDKNFIRKILNAIIIFTFIASLVGIILWLNRVSGLFLIEDRIRSIGIRYVFNGNKIAYWLLYGVYRDSNYAATLSILSIVFSLYLLNNKAPRYFRHLYLTNVFVQFVSFVLSNSRSNTYIAAAIILIYVFLNIKKNIVYRICIGALSMVMFIVIVSGTRNLLGRYMSITKANLVTYTYKWDDPDKQNVRDEIKLNHWDKLNFIVDYSHSLLEGEEVEDVESILDLDIGSNDKVDIGGGGNGRVDITKESLIIAMKKPILGYGTDNVQNEAITVFKGEGRIAKGYVIDNSYLQILVAYGIVGILAIASFNLKYFIEGIKQKNVLTLAYLFIMFCGLFYAEYIIGNNLIVIIQLLLLIIMGQRLEDIEGSIK